MKRLTEKIDGIDGMKISVDGDKNIPCSSWCNQCGKADCKYIENALFRLSDYEDTGLEPLQVQELKNKNTPRKPAFEGDGYDQEGNLVLDEWLCPNCNTRYEVDYDEYDFCPNCGQKLDWSN